MENFLGAFNYDRWPYGYGIGTTALGGQYVARFFNVKPPVIGVESGYGTLVVEMGIVGLILWLVMSVAILFAAWKVVKKLKGSPWFPLGLRDFLVRVLFAFSGHVWRHSGLRRFPFERIFLAVAWFAVPASHHRAFGAVRGQRSRNPTCAPLDTLTCGSRLFRRLSTGAMARSARLRNCSSGSPAITAARYIFMRSASKTFSVSDPRLATIGALHGIGRHLLAQGSVHSGSACRAISRLDVLERVPAMVAHDIWRRFLRSCSVAGNQLPPSGCGDRSCAVSSIEGARARRE